MRRGDVGCTRLPYPFTQALRKPHPSARSAGNQAHQPDCSRPGGAGAAVKRAAASAPGAQLAAAAGGQAARKALPRQARGVV